MINMNMDGCLHQLSEGSGGETKWDAESLCLPVLKFPTSWHDQNDLGTLDCMDRNTDRGAFEWSQINSEAQK